MAQQQLEKTKTSADAVASLTPLQRAEELLRQMTIEEKTMQLSSVFPLALFDTKGTNHSQLDALLKNGIGHVSALGLIGHKTPEELAKAVNAIQRYLVTETRLKIPAIFHNEAMSGVVAPHFTAFPTSIGLAATWDPTATEAMADIIRRQMRAVGMLQALAPVMDVARDARWGRVSETYGEDPYLVSAMSVAYTRGVQGVLAYTGLSGELVMEPGPIELSAGSSSSDIRSSAEFTVTGKTRTIKGEERAFLSTTTVA